MKPGPPSHRVPQGQTMPLPVQRLRLLICFWIWPFLAGLTPGQGESVEDGGVAVVVYNQTMPESRDVAQHYAARRKVPETQVIGLPLPTGEIMSRADYRAALEGPLVKALESRGLFTFGEGQEANSAGHAVPKVVAAKVRYLVLCYGVPSRIQRDGGLIEPSAAGVREELRRNEAAVDSELALLPRIRQKLPITGPAVNPAAGATNTAALHPTNGVWMVARLDGPSAAVARALVDKAMQAESEGLWGRAYFDLRSITNAGYKLGDDWIRASMEVARATGYESVVDERPETFTPGFPLSHVAFYAGWYDAQVSGPWAAREVEFMPGAFAYHLHSFSAAHLRTTYENWVGPFLDRGVTATMGCVDEPYLEGTPNLPVFFSRFIMLGFSFGEAALAAQDSLSWQTTVIGDPLYRPFARPPQERHERLAATKDPRLEWSVLKVVNINLATGVEAPALIDYLEKEPLTATSAVLQEKLGDLNYSRARFPDALDAYEKALKRATSPNQKIRLHLSLARTYALYQRKQEAYDHYQAILTEHPDYGDSGLIHQRQLPLAQALKRTADVERLEAALRKQGLLPPGT